jgi:flagellar basal-body rod modification protein FlgD
MVGQAAAQQTGVTSLVGKQVEFNTNSVSLTVGQPTLLNSSLAADASSVTAVITDSTGKTVRTLTLGGHAAGPMPIAWDGRDQTGNPLPTGTYTVNVTATDPKGASVGVSESASGLVSGVSFSGGTTQLLVGSSTVQLSNVTQVSQVTPNTPVTP